MAASVNIKVNSDFAQASADLKKFGNVSETEAKKIKKFSESFKTEQIDKFIDRNKRNAAAIKATRGPLESAQAEYKGLQREIERLIKKGLDPQDESVQRLTKDYKRLGKELEDVGKESKDTGKSMSVLDGVMVGLGASLINVAQEGFRMFIEFSRESAEAASMAQETFGKFSVVFRDIEEDAQSAAKTIASDFDLAASSVHQLLGDTGDILTGLGFDQETALDLSKQVATLGLDLASFTNFAGGAEGASAALTKALLGEAESAKALGIVIRQDTAEYKNLVAGLMEAEGVGLTQAKALAALQIATEQSKNAVGDYARTLESAANVQRTMDEQIKRSKENWGALLNEGITPIRRAFRDFLKEMNDNAESARNLDDALEGVAGADIARAIREQEEALADAEKEYQKLVETGMAEISVSEIIIVKARQNLALLKEQQEAQLAIERVTNIRATIARSIANEAEREAQAILEVEETQKRLAQQLEDKYIDARAEVLNILESEKTEVDKLEEKYNELSQTPWATGALENQRIEALDILSARIDELRAKELEGSENIISFAESRAQRERELMEGVETQRQAAAQAQKDIEAEITENLRQQTATRISIAQAGFTATANLIGGISAIITEGFGESRKVAIAQKALAATQAGINSGVAFTKTLVDGGPFPVNLISAGAILAQGIAEQIKILGTPIPSAQTGGSFQVPETNRGRGDNIGVMAGAGETINVSPRGEGGRAQNISVSIDKQVIFDVVNEGNETGDIRITADNIQQGASVA